MGRGDRFKRRALKRGYKVDEVDDFLDRCEATLAGEPIGDPVTAADVRDVVFRTRWGGYDEWQVDLHLDRLERELSDFANGGGLARGSNGFPTGGFLALPPGPSATGGREREPERFVEPERFEDRFDREDNRFTRDDRFAREPERFAEPERFEREPERFAGDRYPADDPYERFPERRVEARSARPAQEQQHSGTFADLSGGSGSFSDLSGGSGSFADLSGGPDSFADLARGGPDRFGDRGAPASFERDLPPPRVPPVPPASSGAPTGPIPAVPPMRPEPPARPEPPVRPEPPMRPEQTMRPSQQMRPEPPMRSELNLRPEPVMPPAAMPMPPTMSRPPMAPKPADPYASRHGKVDMTVEVPQFEGQLSPFTNTDKSRLAELRAGFKPRRFGSGYDPAQVDRLCDAVAAAMDGQATAKVTDADFDPGQFGLVQGGYFEDEVESALKELRELFARRMG